MISVLKALLRKKFILLLIFAVVGPAVAQTCISPPPGLAHWWPGANNPQDVIGGQGYEGLLINGTSFAPGLVGQAFSFDGIDDWISVAHHDDLNFGTRDFTVAMWVNFSTVPGPEMVLIEKWVQFTGGDPQGGLGWTLSKRSDGLILSFGDGVHLGSCSGICLIKQVQIGSGEWHHVATLRRGTTFWLYWDGQPLQPLTPPEVPADMYNLDTPATTTLKIGHRGNSQDTPGAAPFPPFYFHGLIDEVQIYNRALTDGEILAIYQAGGGGICKGRKLSCQGFEPPMDNGPVTVKKNRVLPFKATLLNGSIPVTNLDTVVPPVIRVLYNSGIGNAIDVTDYALPAGQGTEGNQFEFDGTWWHFNLKTQNYTAQGTYIVSMVSGDTTEYTIDPTCTAQFVIK